MKRLFAVAALVSLGAAMPAAAQDFAGKTVTIVCGYKTGGGYDKVARVLARHLPKYIPGQPNVIVQNMPGANSLIAANHVYNVAKPDGLTIGTFNRNLPIAQLTGVEAVKFDMRKFAWVGSAASESTILAIRSDLPYKTFEDLKKIPADKPLIIGATGPGANTYDFPLLLKELLGIHLKIVSGYPSSGDIMLAVERKEADGRAGSYTSLTPFIDRKLVRPVIRSRAVEEGIENLPVDESFAPNPRAKAIMALRSAPEIVGRPYVMPPKTPEAIVNVMRAAFAKAIADPQLKAVEVMNEVLDQPKDVVAEFSKYIKFGE